MSIWTADTPRWLFFVLVAVAVAAYTACGLLVLGARLRRRWNTRNTTARPLVVWAVDPKELTS